MIMIHALYILKLFIGGAFLPIGLAARIFRI